MRSLLCTLILFSIIFSACGEDNGASGSNVLNYDSENATAPNLPPGEYAFAARFPALITRNVEGRSIQSISFYAYEQPENLTLQIANDSSPTEPATPYYSQEITSFAPNAWNTVPLSNPVIVEGEPLWIILSFDFGGNLPRQVIGCDQGPANPNGDWLYDEADGLWERFLVRIGDSVNWNIRVVLDPL